MNGKSLGLLALAVLCGLGAMFGTSKMLAKTGGKAAVEMQDVIVATRDLKVEEVLTPELVKVVPMAKDSVPAGTFTSYKDVEDRWVQIRTLEGEPILDRKLAPKGTPAGMVSRIRPGMRAFAIDVTEQSGVSGFVFPDSHVDVIHSEAKGNGPAQADTILQDVNVLAAGQVFTRPEDRNIQVRTVTLELTPEQVDTVVAAKVKGQLTLSMRGLNDHSQEPVRKPADEVVDVKPVAVAPEPAKEPEPAPPVKPAMSERHYVWIYRGTANSERVALAHEDAEESEMDAAFPPIDK